MSDTTQEGAKSTTMSCGSAVVVAATEINAKKDFVEFLGIEQASDPLFIAVSDFTQPRANDDSTNKKAPQVATHPLTSALLREQPLLRIRARDRRNFALTRVRRINNRFMINTRDAWTGKERTELIKALKKHGIFDIDNLCEAVPTKTESQILDFIKEAQTTTQDTLEERMKDKEVNDELSNPIAQWLNAFESVSKEQRDMFSAYNLMLPKVFLYISKCEKHPDPAVCGGINYGEAYEYIYHMLSGQPGKELSPETFRFVRKTLLDLSLRARNGTSEQTDFLANVDGTAIGTNHAQTLKVPSETSRITPPSELKMHKALKEIIKIPSANPLNAPMNVLQFRTDCE